MKVIRFSFLILLSSINQVFSQEITMNMCLDTTDTGRSTVIKLWTDYLHSKPDSIYDNPYWNNGEKLLYKSYDLLKSEGYINPSLYHFKLNNKVLSVTKADNGYIIKSMFYRGKSEDVFAITNVFAEKEKDKYYLSNYQSHYTSDWITKQVGIIKYHYFPDYKFDSITANIANSFLNKLSTLLKFKVDTINYFICKDCDDIFRVMGFDYVFSMGNQQECGFFDGYNNIVYATALAGEKHQHELTHTLNKYFPQAHEWLLSGISAFWGGENAQNGKSLIYHIKRVNEYLKLHPEINLNRPTEFWQLDNDTNPIYVIGAILCDKALRDGGIEKLKRCFNYGSSDEQLITMIEMELHIKRDKLNQFFRNRLNEIAKTNELKIILK